MTPRGLEEAILAGDAVRVRELVADDPACWRVHDERAMTLAAENGQWDIVECFLKTLLRAYVVEEVRGILISAGDEDYIGADEEKLERYAKPMLDAHYNRAEAALRGNLSPTKRTMETLARLAARLGSPGLFRHLLDRDLETMLRIAPKILVEEAALLLAVSLVAAGADAGFASASILCGLVYEGKTDMVRFLLEKGADPNIPGFGSIGIKQHALCHADFLSGAARAEMTELLLRHGADIRAAACDGLAALALRRKSEMLDLVERVSPGSDIGLLMGLQATLRHKIDPPAFLIEEYPFVEAWLDQEIIQPMFTGDVGIDWQRKIGPVQVLADDGFLIKCAVVSPYAEAIADFLLDRFTVNLNTRKDPPLALAVIMEKHLLIDWLVENGADIYGDGASAFTEALRVKNIVIDASLDRAAKTETGIARMKFSDRHGTRDFNLTALRETVEDGETGLALAARAGWFEKLIEASVVRNLNPQEFLSRGKTGASLLFILAARGEYGSIFDERVWRENRVGALAVWDALPPAHQARARASFTDLSRKFASEDNRKHIAKSAFRFKL